MPSEIAIQATQWSELPNVDSVKPFSSKDRACLKELYGVLKKYNQQKRFGVALLHSHFHVDPNEFLLETTNAKERTQAVRPVKKDEYGDIEDKSIIATIVKLVDRGDGEPHAICQARCAYIAHH